MKTPRIVSQTLSILTAGLVLSIGRAFGETGTPPLEFCQAAPPAAPKPEPGELFTKEWRIPANLLPPFPASVSMDREVVTKWLTSKGVVLRGQATAQYLVKESVLLVEKAPQELLDRVDALLKLHPAPRVVERKANDPMIPKLDLREATPTEAFKVITAATGIKIFYTPPSGPETKITLSLSNLPASQAFIYVTNLANLKFTYEPDGVHVSPQ